MKHDWHGPKDHASAPYESDNCMSCVLSVCKVCGAGEAELTVDCPGRRTTPPERDAVMNGKLEYFRGKWWQPIRRR